ncbi:hypothetical protein GF389_00865 [Candidatus Dojkabacteria bacterium]|nr:hypothetical protein [Candidatus Dojkabacteria bacterium]
MADYIRYTPPRYDSCERELSSGLGRVDIRGLREVMPSGNGVFVESETGSRFRLSVNEDETFTKVTISPVFDTSADPWNISYQIKDNVLVSVASSLIEELPDRFVFWLEEEEGYSYSSKTYNIPAIVGFINSLEISS